MALSHRWLAHGVSTGDATLFAFSPGENSLGALVETGFASQAAPTEGVEGLTGAIPLSGDSTDAQSRERGILVTAPAETPATQVRQNRSMTQTIDRRRLELMLNRERARFAETHPRDSPTLRPRVRTRRRVPVRRRADDVDEQDRRLPAVSGRCRCAQSPRDRERRAPGISENGASEPWSVLRGNDDPAAEAGGAPNRVGPRDRGATRSRPRHSPGGARRSTGPTDHRASVPAGRTPSRTGLRRSPEPTADRAAASPPSRERQVDTVRARSLASSVRNPTRHPSSPPRPGG